MSYSYSYLSSEMPSREKLEQEQLRLIRKREHDIGGKEDKDGERSRKRTRWDQDRKNDRYNDERQFKHLRADRTTIIDSFTQNDSLIPVLRHILLLESLLDSLGPKTVKLLSEALYLEQNSNGGANILISREELFLETVREKLTGLLEVGEMDKIFVDIAYTAVRKLKFLLSFKNETSSSAAMERFVMQSKINMQSHFFTNVEDQQQKREENLYSITNVRSEAASLEAAHKLPQIVKPMSVETDLSVNSEKEAERSMKEKRPRLPRSDYARLLKVKFGDAYDPQYKRKLKKMRKREKNLYDIPSVRSESASLQAAHQLTQIVKPMLVETDRSVDSEKEAESIKEKRLKMSRPDYEHYLKEKLGDAYDPSYKKNLQNMRQRMKANLTHGAKTVPTSGPKPSDTETAAKQGCSNGSNPATSASGKRRKDSGSDEKPPWETEGSELGKLSGPYQGFNETLVVSKMAVVPLKYPEEKLSEEQISIVRSSLYKNFFPDSAGRLPQFLGNHSEKGALLFTCANKWTKDWLLAVIPRIVPWEGGKLRVAPKNEILVSFKVAFTIPPELARYNNHQLLETIEAQNLPIKTSGWKIVGGQSLEGGYKYVVAFLDEESLVALQNKAMKIYMGLSRVLISLIKK